MAVYEALLLNTVVPQIQAAQAGDSYVMVVNATTPALRITQTGTGNALEVEDSANPDATPFVVTAGGDVGIGTSSPAAKLHIAVASAAVDGTKGVRITNPAGTIAVFECGSAGDSFIGTTSGSDFNIRTGNTVRATFDLSGNLAIANGNLVMSTSGKGIDFSATSSGTGTMTSELLADYEEGTFSPTVVGSTSAGTATYGSANGRYTKVGRIVEFEIYLDWTSGTGTGNLLFGGLPFTANASLPYASVSLGYLHNFNWAASTFPMALANGTQVNFFVQTLGGGSIASMAYSASGTVYVSGTYTV